MIGVSILHTLFALVVYRIELTVIVEREVFNALKGDSAAGIVACFLLFGILLFVSGIAIYTLERLHVVVLPAPLGWSLVLLVALGVMLMPASGSWLVFPPAIAAIMRNRRKRINKDGPTHEQG